jgi:hypothetical protein
MWPTTNMCTLPSHLLNLSSSFHCIFHLPLSFFASFQYYTGIQNMNDLRVCEIILHQSWFVIRHEIVKKKEEEEEKETFGKYATSLLRVTLNKEQFE